MEFIHNTVMGQDDAVISIDMTKGFWDKIFSAIVGIIAGLAILLVVALAATGVGALASVIIGSTVTASIGSGAIIVSVAGGIMAGVAFHNAVYPDDLILPIYSISPEEIFKGQILLFDIDFFNPVETIYARLNDNTNIKLNDYATDKELNDAVGERKIEGYFYPTEGHSVSTNTYSNETEFNDAVQNGEIVRTSKQNTALDLQSLVSQWYSAIRNIAIVLSMSVLLYIGIRMMLSSVAQDKAKYKQMLMDWLISICLLFFMHYIMAFSITLVDEFTKVISAANSQSGSTGGKGYEVTLEEDKNGKLLEKLEDLGMYDPDDPDGAEGKDYVDKAKNADGEDSLYVMWPTNLMGQLRLQAQMSYGDASFVGYGLCFFVLTLLTIFFVFTYLKRVLYMAFLTMIAPLVALTYPIDKISDGQAQAFNKWLKEYIFNLLIQPLHLLIYTILVTSAFNLAGKNPLYSIVAIGFMIPAEKLMRSFFGFEKASTPGSMAGAAVGAGLVNSGLQKLLHPSFMGGGKGGSGKGGDGSSDSSSSTKIGYKDKVNSIDQLSDGGNKNNDGQNEDDNGGINFVDGNDSDDAVALESGTGNGDGSNEQEQLPRMKDPGSYSALGDFGRFVGRKALGNRVTGTPIRKIRGAAGYVAGGVKGIAGGIKNKASGAIQGIQNNDKFRYFADSKEGQAIKGAGRAIKYTAKQGIRQTRKTVGGAIGALPNVATKAAAGVALGATAGAIGAGVAIASGDPSNLITYGGGAFATAAAIGASRAGINTSDSKSAIQISRERAFYGDKYDEHVADRNLKQLKRSTTQKEELEKDLGADAVNALYKNKTIDEYYKNDVTSAKDIAALEALKKDEEAHVTSTRDAIAVKDLYDKYGSFDKMKSDDRELYKQDLANKFRKNLSAEKANEKMEEVVSKIERFHKINKNFQ